MNVIEWISDLELMVIWTNRAQNQRIVNRCTWQKNTMECEELIEEKEENGWLGTSPHTGFSYENSSFIFMESGQILFRKPDDSPARKFQIFLVEREGALKQITKGEEEGATIISTNSRWVLFNDVFTLHYNISQMSALNIIS